ncbi:MAG: hypothetical protein MJZ76_01180 [Bacteroidales bacterium]|nr:hypothetical protein [Bacteroidales bacterium]
MKKALVILVSALIVAGLATSCKKSCTCKSWKDGKLTGKSVIYDNDEDYQYCKKQEITETINGVEYKYKCK